MELRSPKWQLLFCCKPSLQQQHFILCMSCFLQVRNLVLWRDRWMVWLSRAEAWRAEEVNHWNYEKKGPHYAIFIWCEQTHSPLMYAFNCKPSTMYINEVTLGPFCHPQTCWWHHSSGKERRAGQALCQWHHTVSSHLMKSRGSDSVSLLCVQPVGLQMEWKLFLPSEVWYRQGVLVLVPQEMYVSCYFRSLPWGWHQN